MVEALLWSMFTQKLRNVGNMTLREMLEQEFADGQPLPVVTAVYALSLVSLSLNYIYFDYIP